MEQPSAAIVRRRWSWKKKALLQLALLPLWLVCAELLFRGWLQVRGAPYDATQALERIATLFTSTNALAPAPQIEAEDIDPDQAAFYRSWHAHPFYGFESFDSLPKIQKDMAAFGGARDSNEYTILVVGGSVAWLFEPRGTNALREKLLEDERFRGRTIRFLNYARPAYKQPQQLMLVAYFLNLGIRPDAVLNLDGLNESAFAWSNLREGASPVYPDLSIWAHAVHGGVSDRRDLDILLDIREMQRQMESIAKFAIRYRLYASSLLGRMTIARLSWRASHAESRRRQYVSRLAGETALADLRGPIFAGGTEAAVDAAVRNWAESSRSLQSLCATRSIYYFHMLQPTLFDTGSKQLTESEIATQGNNSNFTDGVQAIYPRLRKAGAEMHAQGVNFHDGSMVFAAVSEALYYDHCHFNRLGNEILAARIAKDFLSNLPPPVDLAHETTKD